MWFNWNAFIDPATYFSDTFCKMANFLDVGFSDFSNWLIAAITAERIVVLAVPLKVKDAVGCNLQFLSSVGNGKPNQIPNWIRKQSK